MKLVSIIIPVYNVKDYLRSCIESAVKQDYENKEIVVIDDGSTDGSSEICDDMGKQYESVFVYHKRNGGLSSARNYGINKANGDYYFFLDSDDTISPHCISFLMLMINDTLSSIASVDMKPVYEVGYSESDDNKKFEYSVISHEEALINMFIRNGMGVSACGKLYSKNLFVNALFPEGRLYEDLQTTPYIVNKCNKVAYSTEKLYYWYQRTESITHRDLSEKDIKLFDYMDSLVSSIGDDGPEIREAAICRYFSDAFFTIIYRMNKQDYDNYYSIIKKHMMPYIQGIFNNKYLKMNKKIQAYLFVFTPNIYRVLKKIVLK